MATLGHVAVGVAAARWRDSRPGAPPLAFSMLGLSALSLLPDADFVAFLVAIPYSHPFGHGARPAEVLGRRGRLAVV